MTFMELHTYSKNTHNIIVMSLKGQQCHLATFNLYPLNSMLLRCYLTLEQVPGVAHCTRLVVLVTKAKYVQIQ